LAKFRPKLIASFTTTTTIASFTTTTTTASFTTTTTTTTTTATTTLAFQKIYRSEERLSESIPSNQN
jgi:hypothetical protein